MSDEQIVVEGACQNNLKNLDLRLPLGELIVVTGVSGSGKSSLAFDTIYSEGQRRYVETFSPYARQFLDRMDKPSVTRIDGIPPAIAIDQTNPVRTSRSTVGTMTELNDHLKLLFARAATLYCRGCERPVRRDTPQTIVDTLLDSMATDHRRVLVTFSVRIPANFSDAEVTGFLAKQGYARVHKKHRERLEVIQDRVQIRASNTDRITEDVEAALKHGRGLINIYPIEESGEFGQPLRFSSEFHCASCDIRYQEPIPNLFSFNSPMGACETCRGFGRTMGIDYRLVIPNESLSLADGAVKTWQSPSYSACQIDLVKQARRARVPVDVAWRDLSEKQRRWVIEGDGGWHDDKWYGVERFFDWIETKSYKMHIRVLLSKYRSYDLCPDCRGSRLKPEAMRWRLRAGKRPATAVTDLSIHDVVQLPIDECHRFFQELRLPAPLDEAADLLLGEIRSRLSFLVEVGLEYLTLDRQSRTLSGGEVQRINLTTALGTSLVNTLFVLDEPSIGLHARDMKRVVGVLHRLRDAGNTLIVVEHDREVMLAADRVLDMGPGPGEKGGEIVFYGRPDQLLEDKRSLTGAFLSGTRAVTRGEGRQKKKGSPPGIDILGASQHNLKNVDVSIPLNRLVCVTGVSGSGKSTLIKSVAYRALRKLKGSPVDPAGEHRELRGHERIDEVVLVDQSPIGKTTRSNPASYVGGLDAIRKAFALQPLATERGYTAGTFSFNSGNGRCPNCGGNGFEHIEMQFLSDVYLRCPDCDGRRYRAEILEVKLISERGSASIADVLEMTVSQAVTFFEDHRDIKAALQPLAAVGLDYLRLGQPVPTLSGGEAQRLKLAGRLAKGTKGKRGANPANLFLFDEPTTGLHFEDISKLLDAFEALLVQGHSVVVIEHNLDVISAADWIIDLGPEGGDGGGNIVATGTPDRIARHKSSHTALALRAYRQELGNTQPPSPGKPVANTKLIEIKNAKEHNLKGVNLDIPRKGFTVITGISGSGKSTVAFDILLAEGQRRYLESLNAYARQFVQPASRPDVDAISGIPPTVAIEQRTSRGGRKSTVATLTEVYHFLRLLFMKLGVQHCPDCDVSVEPQTPAAILAKVLRRYRGKQIEVLAPLVVARKGYYTDLAKWAAGRSFTHLRVDGDVLPTANWPRLSRFHEHNIDLPVGQLKVEPRNEEALRVLLERAIKFGSGVVRIVQSSKSEVLFSTRRACPGCTRSFEELDPRLFSFNSKHGWCQECFGTGLEFEGFDDEQTGEERWWNDWWEVDERVCRVCHGHRLKPEALAVRFKDQNISQITALSVGEARKYFDRLRLSGRSAEIARDLLSELRARLRFLTSVGLSYLTLDRSAPSLSGGEAQRIRLASQLGSNLRGVCYILDEPTIGLHPRDNRQLLDTLKTLERKGNTVVVVEHDEDTIRQAQHIIDLGPGAGRHGGEIVAEGSVAQVLDNPASLTGRFLAQPLTHPLFERRRPAREHLGITGADLHNLKDVCVDIPLERLVCVTGVSGSGKSTLVREVLHHNLQALIVARRTKKRAPASMSCQSLHGWEPIERILEVDQTPIGKTPRSCPATYVGFWTQIRRLFAETSEASIRGYDASRFSFNVKGGRCESCEGQGTRKIEMSFLPDVRVQCEVCNGARFNRETLAISFKGKDIGEILAMSVDEAVGFFAAHRSFHQTLTLLQDVGLGYLTLGQQSPTLSGGEAQRIKLVTELSKAKPVEELPKGRVRRSPATLYILDEPTIGLHMADVEKLAQVLHRLVDAGNTVIVIEHNLDVIAEADWVIDLGPEGGDGGGRIVTQGPPEKVAAKRTGSHTAKVLKPFLRQRRSESSPGA